MKISITFNDCTEMEALKLLNSLGAGEDTPNEDNGSEAIETRSSKKGKGTKASKVEDEDTLPESDDDDMSIDGEEDSSGDDEEQNGPTLALVMEAFKKFVKKHKGDKGPAIKVLKKFKVKSPSELDESDYAAVIKALK